MANPARGDVTLSVGGRERVLRLTLGALAELEDRLGAGGLVAVAERFETGAFAAADLIALLAAGLRGAGGEDTEADVAAMRIDGGAVAAARAAGALLEQTFRGT